MATVAIDGAANAALLAAQILALGDEALAFRIQERRREMAEKRLPKLMSVSIGALPLAGKAFFN
nr:AIR carboxylase family protein [uncultured Sphaerochaeta sp.]